MLIFDVRAFPNVALLAERVYSCANSYIADVPHLIPHLTPGPPLLLWTYTNVAADATASTDPSTLSSSVPSRRCSTRRPLARRLTLLLL